jgi:hypothetical protein
VKSNASAIWRAHLQGACFANPCFTQLHPTCIPAGDTWQSKLTLMSESLRNDGRVWLPAQPGDGRPAAAIPEAQRDYFLERQYPTYGNMVPRDVASRRARELCLEGRGVGPGGRGVYLDLAEAIRRDGREAIESRYGNLLEMYARITGEDPLASPLRIYPAPHYTMGGLWVDYHLMSTIPGLFVLGEANFSEHGANRLGASALMQGLADGYFIAPATVTAWLAGHPQPEITADHPACRSALAAAQARIAALRPAPGRSSGGGAPGDGGGGRTATDLHRELGLLMIEVCGISRSAPELRRGLAAVEALRQEFGERVVGVGATVVDEVEADFLGPLVDLGQGKDLRGMHDGGVQPGFHALVEVDRVQDLSCRWVETEGDVRQTEYGRHSWQLGLDATDSLDGLDPVLAALFHASGQRKSQGVEHQVFGTEPIALHGDVVDGFGRRQLPLCSSGLALGVDARAHHGRTELLGQGQERIEPGPWVVALLEVDRVDDGSAAQPGQRSLDDRSLGGVDHDGRCRLCGKPGGNLLHVGHTIGAGVIHADVNEV